MSEFEKITPNCHASSCALMPRCRQIRFCKQRPMSGRNAAGMPCSRGYFSFGTCQLSSIRMLFSCTG